MIEHTYNLYMKKSVGVFASNIKRLRKNKKLTQGEVAEALGISLVGYQNYEAGRRMPKRDVLKGLCEFLEVSTSDLHKDSHNAPKTFAQSLPASRLMTLISEKMGLVPDKIYEAAQGLDESDEIWDVIVGLLEETKMENAKKLTTLLDKG